MRFVNGSILERSPTLLGTTMSVFARSTRPLRAALNVSGRTIDPGDTVDASVFKALPSTCATANVCPNTRFALFDTPGKLGNGGWVNGATPRRRTRPLSAAA